MVALDVREDFVQAVLDRSPQGDVLVAVSLAATEPLLAPACVQAVAVLLLRAAGAVRMVRATARQDAGPGFEVHLGPEPLADELGRALAALSVAWRLAGREADVLARDERVARQYVETVHGFDAETVRGFIVSDVPEAERRHRQAADRAGAAGEEPAAPPEKGEDSP